LAILDDTPLNEAGFAHRDLLGLDRWDAFTVSTSVSSVGALSTSGRFRIVGRKVEFQAQVSATTSVALTSGVHFIALPVAAAGLAGQATMTNTSTNTATLAAINVSTSRCYLPTQTPTAATLAVAGWYELGEP
jgi:hypothetical protein